MFVRIFTEDVSLIRFYPTRRLDHTSHSPQTQRQLDFLGFQLKLGVCIQGLIK